MLSKLMNALTHPVKAFQVIKRIIKSQWYILWYQHILHKATFGDNFQADGTLSIKGPGKVVFGDNVRIGMTVTPWTYKKNALIFIDNDSFLNGTRFACAKHIYVGRNAMLADCRIMDYDFHGVHPEKRHNPDPPKSIIIQDNVWVTIQCVILKGVKIGEGSTITPNSVVTNNIDNNTIAGGNPAKTIKVIENV